MHKSIEEFAVDILSCDSLWLLIKLNRKENGKKRKKKTAEQRNKKKE